MCQHNLFGPTLRPVKQQRTSQLYPKELFFSKPGLAYFWCSFLQCIYFYLAFGIHFSTVCCFLCFIFFALMHLKLCKWLNKQTRLYTKNTSTNTTPSTPSTPSTVIHLGCVFLFFCLSFSLSFCSFLSFYMHLCQRFSTTAPRTTSAPEKPNFLVKIGIIL